MNEGVIGDGDSYRNLARKAVHIFSKSPKSFPYGWKMRGNGIPSHLPTLECEQLILSLQQDIKKKKKIYLLNNFTTFLVLLNLYSSFQLTSFLQNPNI